MGRLLPGPRCGYAPLCEQPVAQSGLLGAGNQPPPARAGVRVPRRGRDAGRRPEMLARIRELAIPPAWQDVWICPDRWATSRRPASTPRAASSTSTTAGGRGATRRSSTDARVRPRAARAARRVEPTCARDELDPRARARLRRAAARPRLLPHRRRGLRGGERDLRPGHDPKAHVTLGDGDCSTSTTRRRAASAGFRRSTTPRSSTVVEGAQAPPRRRGRAARVQGGPALGRRALRRHQRVPQGGRGRATTRPRTSAPGTRPCSPRSRWPARPARQRSKTARKRAVSRAREGGRRATSATRRRSAAPPTSTRGCSTASTPG